jgi:hypothetical protein
VRATRVSVIVPVHDRSGLLQEAVESLVATRYPDLEVVIVEGCEFEQVLFEQQHHQRWQSISDQLQR